MRLMIDTNVLIDVLQDRKLFSDDSALVWKLCESCAAEGYISSLSFANMTYVLRKQIDKESVAEMMKDISLIFSFADFNQSILYKAAKYQWDDYEDAIQAATAVMISADYIVTRNTKDYRRSDIPAITPAELLRMFSEKWGHENTIQ